MNKGADQDPGAPKAIALSLGKALPLIAVGLPLGMSAIGLLITALKRVQRVGVVSIGRNDEGFC